MFFAEVAFVVILLAAAVSDVLTYRIPNALVLLLALSYLVWAGFHFTQTDWLSHLGAGLLCLVAGYALYLFRQIGAGDVKLLAAVALWSGLNGLIALLLFMSLSGLFALPLILLARVLVEKAQERKLWKPEWQVPRVLVRRQGVPYGVAIALGGILAMALSPAFFR